MRNRIGSDRPAVVIGCDRLWLVVIGCDRENARTILAFATACHDWKVWLSFLLGLWDLSRGRLPWAFVGICFSCFNKVLLANPCPVPWCHAIAWTKFLGRVSANQRPDSPRCQLLPISTEGNVKEERYWNVCVWENCMKTNCVKCIVCVKQLSVRGMCVR